MSSPWWKSLCSSQALGGTQQDCSTSVVGASLANAAQRSLHLSVDEFARPAICPFG